MVIGVVENLQSSYDFTNKAFRSFSDWIILIVICLMACVSALLVVFGAIGLLVSTVAVSDLPVFAEIPVSSSMSSAFALAGALSIVFIGLGIILALVFGILQLGVAIRVYRGGELSLDSWGGMYLDGLFATIISLLYFIPYGIIAGLNFGLAFLNFHPAIYLVLTIVEWIVLIVTLMISFMALIRFAKTQRFGAAFELKELLNVIAAIGWLRYLANIILVGLVISVIGFICLLIPVVGWALLLVVLPPFFLIWEAKFFANLYESATAAQVPEPEAAIPDYST